MTSPGPPGLMKTRLMHHQEHQRGHDAQFQRTRELESTRKIIAEPRGVTAGLCARLVDRERAPQVAALPLLRQQLLHEALLGALRDLLRVREPPAAPPVRRPHLPSGTPQFQRHRASPAKFCRAAGGQHMQ